MALLGIGWACDAPLTEAERALPFKFAVISDWIWFVERATVTVPPLVILEDVTLADCLALLGGFFADMDGDGEEEAARPFVWIPEGMGRFVLGCGGITGGGIGVVLGAMMTASVG